MLFGIRVPPRRSGSVHESLSVPQSRRAGRPRPVPMKIKKLKETAGRRARRPAAGRVQILLVRTLPCSSFARAKRGPGGRPTPQASEDVWADPSGDLGFCGQIAPHMLEVQKQPHIFGRSGPLFYGISAIDIALWDIAGKAAGVPVCRLLGESESHFRSTTGNSLVPGIDRRHRPRRTDRLCGRRKIRGDRALVVVALHSVRSGIPRIDNVGRTNCAVFPGEIYHAPKVGPNTHTIIFQPLRTARACRNRTFARDRFRTCQLVS